MTYAPNYIVYGWYSDNSCLLQEPGVYLRPGMREPEGQGVKRPPERGILTPYFLR